MVVLQVKTCEKSPPVAPVKLASVAKTSTMYRAFEIRLGRFRARQPGACEIRIDEHRVVQCHTHQHRARQVGARQVGTDQVRIR